MTIYEVILEFTDSAAFNKLNTQDGLIALAGVIDRYELSK